MLKTTLVAMTLLGCDCDAKMCEFISETPAQWSSVADCEAAMKARVTRNSNLGYPLISGVCRVVEQPAQTVAIPAQPTPAVTVAEVAAASGTDETSGSWYDSLAGGSQTVFRKTANGYSSVTTGIGHAAHGAVDWVRKSTGLVASAD